MRCNTCKQFCILFVHKLAASGVAVGEFAVFMAWCSENKACSSILEQFMHEDDKEQNEVERARKDVIGNTQFLAVGEACRSSF